MQTMDHIDHVASRVSLSALSGLLGGSIYATLKGLPLRSTSFRIASSFALVGTAVFGAERVGYVALQSQIDGERRRLLTSHAFAGVSGGALNGYLYHKKPLQGMFYFIPLMLGVAFAELTWEKTRQDRLEAVLLKEKQESIIDHQR